jgi:hypothetical protein
MDGVLLEVVRTFKYLGFTWTDKLSLKPTVDYGLQNIQKSFTKLKWLKRNKDISTAVLRTCFFAYSFPFFNWIFPFFPLLPKSQQKAMRQKFRSGLRLIHRCPFVEANDIYVHTKEKPLDYYVSKYLQKRLAKAHTSDLGNSYFFNDIFTWDLFLEQCRDNKKRSQLKVGHLLLLARVGKMKARHESHLLTWFSFIDQFRSS